MRVLFHKKFEKLFSKLPAKIQDQFYARLTLYISDSRNQILNNHSVGKAYPGCRSIDVTGDYRAVFYEEDTMVVFVAIGTHSQLYD